MAQVSERISYLASLSHMLCNCSVAFSGFVISGKGGKVTHIFQIYSKSYVPHWAVHMW